MTTDATGATGRKRRKISLKNLTKRDEIWYFHKRVNGKKEFNGRRTPFSLGTSDLELAKARRDAVLRAANGAEVDRITGREQRYAAKLGEIFAAYREAPTVRANIPTRERNIADLMRMVRAVKGPDCDVEKLSSCELTVQLVKEWQARKLASAFQDHSGNLVAIEAAKRSLNSLLTHVQSIFSRGARQDFRNLNLPPSVDEFTGTFPVAARKQNEPKQLTDEFVSDLLADVDKLQSEDPGVWAAFQLMTWGGLRNTECYHARASWLEPAALGYRLTMEPTEDFTPKGNTRTVVLPAPIVEALLAQLPPQDPAAAKDNRNLVPAKHATDRHEAIYRRLNAWLKDKGVASDAGKIAYRLRKFFLKKVAEQQGIGLAQSAAGHASIRTTQDHYVGLPKMTEPVRLPVG